MTPLSTLNQCRPLRNRDCYIHTVHSGNSFIGSIPAHWSIQRLKFILSTPLKYGANEAASSVDPDQPRFIRITDIAEDGSLREETFRSLPEEAALPYLLKEGDVLLARSGATIGKSFFYQSSWGRAAYAGYLIRARINLSKSTPRFLHFFTQSDPYWQWVQSIFIQATIQNISAEKYANLVVPIPPLPEQRAIAEFLDRETAKIDELIGKKRRLIELLKEKRQALISRAVTKGLNPNAPMKASEIDWLGDVPESRYFCEVHERRRLQEARFGAFAETGLRADSRRGTRAAGLKRV